MIAAGKGENQTATRDLTNSSQWKGQSFPGWSRGQSPEPLAPPLEALSFSGGADHLAEETRATHPDSPCAELRLCCWLRVSGEEPSVRMGQPSGGLQNCREGSRGHRRRRPGFTGRWQPTKPIRCQGGSGQEQNLSLEHGVKARRRLCHPVPGDSALAQNSASRT